MESPAPDAGDPFSRALSFPLSLLTDPAASSSPPWIPLLAGLVGLVMLSAVISAAEAGIFGFARMRALGGTRIEPTPALKALLAQPRETMLGLLLANLLANTGAVVIWTLLLNRIAPGLPAWGAVALTLFAFAPGLVMVGEVLPRNLSFAAPSRMGPMLGTPTRSLLWILTPLRIPLHWVSRWISLGIGASRDLATVLAAERGYKSTVALGGTDVTLEEDEREMVKSVLDYASTMAQDIMTPRTECKMVSLSSSRDEVAAVFAETHHTRLLVCDESPDHVVGFLHQRDFLLYPDRSLGDSLRPPLHVPPAMEVNDLLEQFRAQQAHLAVVIDEYGGTEGIVTLNDILGAIVGEFDEPDSAANGSSQERRPAEPIRKIDEKRWSVWGRTEIWELNEALPHPVPDDRARTVSGFVVNTLGCIPAEGQTLTEGGWTFEVVSMAGPTIEEIALSPATGPEDAPPSEEEAP